MAQRIAISPEQVREVARQFKQKSQESLAMSNHLNNSVKGIQSQWEGATSQRFYTDFESWKQHMQNHVNLLNNIGLELDRIANTLETTDQQLSRKGEIKGARLSGFGILLNQDVYGNWLVPSKNQKILTFNGKPTKYGCTPTCVSMIIDFWHKINPEENKTVSAQKLLDDNINSFDNGLSVTKLHDDLENLGYFVRDYPNEDCLNPNKSDLISALKEGPVVAIVKLNPAINHLANSGEPHAVVVTGITDDGYVTVSDPWGNSIDKYSWADFDSSWGSDFGTNKTSRSFVTILPN